MEQVAHHTSEEAYSAIDQKFEQKCLDKFAELQGKFEEACFQEWTFEQYCELLRPALDVDKDYKIICLASDKQLEPKNRG